MCGTKFYAFLVLIMLLLLQGLYAQTGNGQFCIDAEPLCGNAQFSYANTSGFSLAESGPNYGCLQFQVNPSWFYLQIATDGDLQLEFEQSRVLNGVADLDVDFIVYGPFSDPRTPCISYLTTSNIVDCSYSRALVEQMDISNARAGEYYLLLITNFSLLPGFISVSQTAGAATTNCVFLGEPITVNQEACQGDVLILDATTTNAINYTWYEDDGSGDSVVISGVNTSTFPVTNQYIYSANAYDVNNVLIAKYEFNTRFYQTPIVPSDIQEFAICDYFGDNDGIAEFNLMTKDTEVLNGLNPADFIVSYYGSAIDAATGDPLKQLPGNYVNTVTTETIYVRMENTISGTLKCFGIGEFDIRVNLIPIINTNNNYLLCFDLIGSETANTPPTIDTFLSVMDYDFKWFKDGVEQIQFTNFSSIIPTEGGDYFVEVGNITTGCVNVSDLIIVNESSPPQITVRVTTQAFANKHVIQVEATNTTSKNSISEYEFSLNNGEWVTGNGNSGGRYTYTFDTNVRFGENTIRARDINGCGENEIKVIVMDYPLFFTPNGDSYNNTWNITAPQFPISYLAQARIFIFDRYGKLLKQLNPLGPGWDGTYNGSLMPTNDYWFMVDFIDPLDDSAKQFRAHFTLKR